MTQDILMSNDEPVAPTNETARNQLQQFCLLAKSAHGAAILELIKQVLDTPSIYVFGELLEMPNVVEVCANGYYFIKENFCKMYFFVCSSKQASMPSITIHSIYLPMAPTNNIFKIPLIIWS